MIAYSPEWFADKYKTMTFDPGFEKQIEQGARLVLAGKDRYEAFVKTNFPKIPWHFIGSIHNLEASCNWLGVLHNGERIVGTGRKTKIVPVGRGPFSTWEEAAIDAVKLKGFNKNTDWSIGSILKRFEEMNGLGYRSRNENSPYVWAQSSVNDGTGKYTSDGHYDPKANANAQTGAATVLKWLENNGSIKVIV